MECIIDIEADSLQPTVIHCIVVKDIKTGEVRHWSEGECLTDFPKFASLVTKFIGHNIISFDAPALNKLVGTAINLKSIEDTLILSQLLNPARDGGHSLESWGKRLNYPKSDFNDFSKFSDEMLKYCINDVELTFKVWMCLLPEMKKISRRSIDLEYRIREIIDEQESYGFRLDVKKAMCFAARLQDKSNEIEREVQEVFKPLPSFVKDYTLRLKKDGSLSSVGLNHLEDKSIVAGDHSVIGYQQFNMSSRHQIARHLMMKGWKPEKFTETGHPTVDEAVLKDVQIKEAQLIYEFLLIQNRLAKVQSWLDVVDDNEKVHGSVLTLRAISGRMAHHSPNVAQVPASYSPYGKESRECWTASSPSRSLVGCDASSLELRALAHYLNDPAFAKEVVEGDVHTANQKAAGLETRDQAKTFIYAFIYGAGPAKIGSIVGGDAKVGLELIEQFLRNVPALATLRKRVDIAAKRGYLIGLDGRRLIVREPHAAFNLLIQGAGAVICKSWLAHIRDMVALNNLDAKLVASIHDEYQHDVLTEHAESFGNMTKIAMSATQDSLGVRCKLASEYKIGKNWCETH